MRMNIVCCFLCFLVTLDTVFANSPQDLAEELTSAYQRGDMHGGSAAGAAFLARTKAMAAALKANDINAMIKAEGGGARYRYADVDIDTGKPISLQQRELRMQSWMNREIVDVKVLGGYQLDDFAILIVLSTGPSFY